MKKRNKTDGYDRKRSVQTTNQIKRMISDIVSDCSVTKCSHTSMHQYMARPHPTSLYRLFLLILTCILVHWPIVNANNDADPYGLLLTPTFDKHLSSSSSSSLPTPSSSSSAYLSESFHSESPLFESTPPSTTTTTSNSRTISSSWLSNAEGHSHVNNQDKTTKENNRQDDDMLNGDDPNMRPTSLSTTKQRKLLPNQSRRQSKLDNQPSLVNNESRLSRSEAIEPMGQHGKSKNQPNSPSSMDDIIGGLLQLMGGNMKLPPGAQQQMPPNGMSPDKLANLLSNLGGNHKIRPPHGPPMHPSSIQRPPIPPFGSLPNLNIAKLQNRPQMVSSSSNGQFPMYQNFPFIPFLSSGSGGRPAIPLSSVAGGSIPHKLPPNIPPINGLTKSEMDALYSQFLASGGQGPDKSALISNLMKLANNKPGLPPGLQLPPGLVLPSKSTSNGMSTADTINELILSPSLSFDTMQPMTTRHRHQQHNPTTTIGEEPPQIITMADEPSIFEMVVKHTLGSEVETTGKGKVIPVTIVSTPSIQLIEPTKTINPTRSTVNFASTNSDIVVTEIRNQHNNQPLSKDTSVTKSTTKASDIVYGKRINKPTSEMKTVTSTLSSRDLMPSISTTPKYISGTKNKEINSSNVVPTPKLSSTAIGQPMVVPVDMNEGVRPKIGSMRSSSAIKPTPTSTIEPKRTIASVTPSKTNTYLSSAKSSVEIMSPHKSKSSSSSSLSSSSSSSSSSTSSSKPHGRRPQFRPRPNVPIVRIDTCIVGDDSTCDVSLNEKCLTELGLSSCQCRPGFARIAPRTMCIPVISLSLSFRVDRMNDKKVQFTRPLLNPNSEEYQYLEYESIIALNSMFTASKSLASELMGVKVNRFYSVGGRTIVNATVNLRAEGNETNASPLPTMPSSLKRTLTQELIATITNGNNQLGESQLWVDSSSNAITRVDDLNECSNADHNDCSRHARCFNEFGTFRCECEPGYEDRHADDRHRSGRTCSSCSPSHCSNRGECLIVRGERVCKCKANFFGAQCDIDVEVLGVAVGGSIAALVIIVITFICLYMWNQRFKQEQQKIEAMSAASGHTFSYVNKHGPPTMSRMSIDDRYGRSWTTHYSDSQQHLLSSSSGSGNSTNPPTYYGMSAADERHQGQPVYATPVRVVGQANSVADYEPHSIPYPDYGTARSGLRSLKLKPNGTTRQANLSGSSHGLHYPSYTMKLAPDSYNETEFSTRELIYSPAHLYATNPRTSMGYYS